MRKIAIALSGGVDSAVAAKILLEQGHEVIAIHMQNWHENDNPYCQAQQDLSDAKAVADFLGIPLHITDFSDAYQKKIFAYFLDAYHQGITPNPDVFCNSLLKYDDLLNYAKSLGVEKMATGHYARVQEIHGSYHLLKGLDPSKDQSYFLSALNQDQLAWACFPLGEHTKEHIRALAEKWAIPVAKKKDSTGLCFIGERPFKAFLSEYAMAKPGDIVDSDGKVLGRHDGLMFYTIGQRKGLAIGGMKEGSGEPFYVAGKDMSTNTLLVVQGENHPKLFASGLTCGPIHWLLGKAPEQTHLRAKVRYRQNDQACTIQDNQVIFDEPQRAITPGQIIVFYDEDVCLGSATILQ